jgi:drug/metabolite transporter (DMT)-like permease
MKPEWKGYLGVFVSVLAMSNVYIFSKSALRELSLSQFGVYWFGIALLLNIVYLLISRKYKELLSINKQQIFILIKLGFIEVIATTGFFAAIKIMENPATVSFLANIGPVYVTLLGFWILKEKLSRYEIFGGALTLLGAFIISYKPNWNLSDNFILGLMIIGSYTFIFALGKVLSKKHIAKFNPSILSINRVIFLLIFSLIIFFLQEESFTISNKALLNIFMGASLGPLLAALAGYYAIQFIPASKASLLGTFKGFLILITSYIYFGIFPLWYQVFGGTLTVLGVVLITLTKQKTKKIKL